MFKKALLVLAVLSLISGCTDQTKEELFKEGLKHIDDNNPRGAIVFFKNALEKDPNFFEARFQLAKAYHNVGNLDSAEKELKKVIRQNTSLKEARLELARVYLQKSMPDDALDTVAGLMEENDGDVLEIAGLAHASKGEYSEALTFLEKAVSTDNGRAEAGVALAGLYAQTNRMEEAKSRIAEILRKEPANRRALHALAGFQAGEGDTLASIATYEQILKEYPADVEAAYRKGVMHIKAGQYDEAIAVADGIIRSFEKRPEGHRLKGIALFHKKDFDNAIAALQQSLAIQPDPGAYYFLALCHYYEQEPEQAITQLFRALDLNPSFAQARVFVSMILLGQKRVDDAIEEAKKAIKLDESNALTHNILGSAYMAKGMYDEGLEELNRAIEISPGLVNAHIKKGLLSLSMGKHAEAETELKTAVEMAPDVLNSRAVLASYYIRNKDYEKAIEILKGGVKGQREDAIIYNLIADAMLRLNNIDGAVEYLQKAQESDPDYYASHFTLAKVYFLKGEHDKGLEELRTIIKRSPDNLRALLSLASILEAKGRDEEAVKYFVQAGETGKTEGYIALAKYHVRKREPEKALAVLDKAIEKNSSETALYELKGRILINGKRFDDAIRTCENIERIDADRGLPCTVSVYVLMKEPQKAINRIRKELRKDPERLGLMADISRIYLAMGKTKDAADVAEQIIEKNPGSSVGYMALASVYQKGNEIGRAIETLKNAPPTDNDANLHVMLGGLYVLQKNNASALDAFRKAEEIKPDHVPAIFQQGAVLHIMGKTKEAAEVYQKVLRLSMNYVPALNNLAYIYAEDDRDIDSALQLATRAYVLAPADGSVNDTLGFVLLRKGKVKDALAALKKAVEILPDNPSVHYHLALAYKESGDNPQALESVRQALRLGDFPEAEAAELLLRKLEKG